MEKTEGKLIVYGAVVLAVIAVIFAAVYLHGRPTTTEGKKDIVIEVTDSKGDTTDYEVTTEAEYLKQAMDELAEAGSGFSYSGSDGDYGLMVDTINGERAVFDLDNAYWALFVNDEFAQFGADTQPLADGDKYAWKYALAE